MQTQVPQLYKQQPHNQDANNALEWWQCANDMLEKAKKQPEGRENHLTNILRWEEDGGQIVEING